jgi:hypothetical protein
MNWDVVSGSLLSIPVLLFILGIIGARIHADLRLPDAVYQAITLYLLLAIGLKGGVALRSVEFGSVLPPIAVTIILGIVIPILAFAILRVLTNLSPVDRGAMAAHYGSTSLVTFTAAIVFLDTLTVPYEGFVVTLLAIMEVPGILVGLLLARKAMQSDMRLRTAVAEVITSKSIVLLAGGLVIGWLAGSAGYAQVEPVFGTLFAGVLALFLLEMGALAGRRLGDVRRAGLGIFVFAIGFPVFAGTLGIFGGFLAGLSPGGSMILGVLAASASYIAAPAAVRLALPTANPGITITSTLGITFPFNLIVGIPLYWWIAQQLSGVFA